MELSPASAVAGKAYQLCLAGEPWPCLENVNLPEVVPHFIRADWAVVTRSALNYTYSSPGNFSRSRTQLPACFKWISCRELVEPMLEFISVGSSKCLVVSCKLPWFVSCTSWKLPLSSSWAELLCLQHSLSSAWFLYVLLMVVKICAWDLAALVGTCCLAFAFGVTVWPEFQGFTHHACSDTGEWHLLTQGT